MVISALLLIGSQLNEVLSVEVHVVEVLGHVLHLWRRVLLLDLVRNVFMAERVVVLRTGIVLLVVDHLVYDLMVVSTSLHFQVLLPSDISSLG